MKAGRGDAVPGGRGLFDRRRKRPASSGIIKAQGEKKEMNDGFSKAEIAVLSAIGALMLVMAAASLFA